MGKKPPEPPTQPVMLGQMRALGMRSLYVTCSACGYASTVNVDDWQDDVFITSFGRTCGAPSAAISAPLFDRIGLNCRECRRSGGRSNRERRLAPA
jgi:hypothetical protein